MPDLDFQVTDVKAAARGLTPLLQFQLAVRNRGDADAIHAVMLHTQIQLEAPKRTYSVSEKEKLTDLFGAPERWSQTLRNKLWGHADTTIGSFKHMTEATLTMPCTFDLNVAASKYFHALEGGEAPLLFLFSGTVFYEDAQGRLQVEKISWDKECEYRVPASLWRDMMHAHYPNTAWVFLHRELFDRLLAYKRRHGLTNWDEAIERLLSVEEATVEIKKREEEAA